MSSAAATKRTFTIVLTCALVLLGLRLSLPYAVRKYAIHTLNLIPGYGAQIEKINISLWRGAYQIKGIEIWRIEKKVPVPLFSSSLIDFSIQWKEIFHGALVGKIHLLQPKLNFVGSKNKAESQTNVDKSWQDRAKELFPFNINHLQIDDGEIHFQNFDVNPPIDLFVKQLHMTATNLNNSRDINKTLKSSIKAEAVTLGRGILNLDTEIDPLAKVPTFKLEGKLENVAISELNPFFVHYAGINFEKGVVGFYTEAAAKDGYVEGYVKPIVKDLKVVGDPKNQLTLGQKIKEFFVGLAAAIVENKDKETVATKIEFSGKLDDPKLRPWEAVALAFHHAWIKALLPRIEHSVEFKDIDKEKIQKKSK